MITNNNEKHKVRTLATLLNSLVACIVNFQTLIKMRLRTKSAVTIEQKGCCRLRRCSSNLPEGVVLVNHAPHAQEASIILVFYTV